MDDYTQFEKGDIIERYQGDPAESIKNNVPLTFKGYGLCGQNAGTLYVNESSNWYTSDNFRKWVEEEPKKEPYREFKKGDLIERYQGEAAKGIKNNISLTFYKYSNGVPGNNILMVYASTKWFASKNFRKFVEVEPKKEPYEQFKKGDKIERYQGEDTKTIKNNMPLTFKVYASCPPGNNTLWVNESWEPFKSKNFRKWVEIVHEPVKRKIKIGDEIKGLSFSGIVEKITESGEYFRVNGEELISKKHATLLRTKEEIEAQQVKIDPSIKVGDEVEGFYNDEDYKDLRRKGIVTDLNYKRCGLNDVVIIDDSQYLTDNIKLIRTKEQIEEDKRNKSTDKFNSIRESAFKVVESYLSKKELKDQCNEIDDKLLKQSLFDKAKEIAEAKIDPIKNKPFDAEYIIPVGTLVKVFSRSRRGETGIVIISQRSGLVRFWHTVKFDDGSQMDYYSNELAPAGLDHSITEDPPVYDTGTDRLKLMAKQAKETGTEKSFIDALINGWIC